MREKRKSNRGHYNALKSASRMRRSWDVRYLNDVTRWSRERARAIGVDWDLSREFLKLLWEEQQGRCSLSSIDFRETDEKGKASIFSPSLDRVKPDLGYTRGNVRFILQGLNALKGRNSDEDLVFVCRAVAQAFT